MNEMESWMRASWAIIAGLLLVVMSSPYGLASDRNEPPSSARNARVTVGGVVYSESAAINTGTYHGQFVTANARRLVRNGFAVWFVRSPELEIWFEAERKNFPTYSWTIEQDGKTLATGTAKNWGATVWRWRQTAKPVVRDHAAVLALLKLPLRAGSYSWGIVTPYAGPMSTASVYKYMPSTGERPDIGPLPEWASVWLITGDANALQQTLHNAEATGSFSTIFSDPQGKPYDILANPRGAIGFPGTPQIDADLINSTETEVESAHAPDLGTVAWLATDDPYYLWLQQHLTSHLYLRSNPQYTTFNGVRVIRDDQTRGYAWTFRSLMLQAALVGENVGWMRPGSYWKQLLANQEAWVRKHMTDQFYFWKSGDPWMNDMLAMVMLWAARFFPWCDEIGRWLVNNTINRTNGTSGWNKSCPTAYKTNRSVSSTWKELQDASDPGPCRGDNINMLKWSRNSGPAYHHYTQAVLRVAGHAALADYMKNGIAGFGATPPARWNF